MQIEITVNSLRTNKLQ